ncbi:MAG TPA: hypothetical protein O0X25_00290 [Methanocorpusculum sp.]|nr:hypothetical protein [Methanocorpusculum sp.]HJJ40136.1 hypothetical protein [Methanocorpusculum sp.]HJJ49047.1 hypothetical protein [Methanocorpusculum sp.]HJJ57291.1 hypothetical protein [Methanocorpusculum sp.]
MLNTVGGIPRTVEPQIITGVGLLLISLLLIILRKRDMIAIFFMMLSFCYIAIGFSLTHIGALVMLCFYGLVLLTLLVTLTGKDQVKWLLIIIPVVMIARSLVDCVTGQTIVATFIISALIGLYFAFACASEKLNLP